MTSEHFENILKNPESDILDFKKEQYDFINNSNEVNTAKFIKDIICFCNTIRTETAYIILGVSITNEGEKELIGIEKFVDDSTFQDKIKNKVTPVPNFNYSVIKFNNKFFGVFEIPVKRYEEPIFSTGRMRGLESGKVYLRRSSSNSEATGRETILISKWLESLPSRSVNSNIHDEVSEIMIKTTSQIFPLSEQIATSLKLANKYGSSRLLIFCEAELSGWYNRTENIDVGKDLSYRIQKVVMTPNNIDVNPYSLNNYTAQQILDELKRIDKNAFEEKLLFKEPITQIESYLSEFSTQKKNLLLILTSNAETMFKNPKFETIKSYVTKYQLDMIYNGIRQKLISLLLDIN